jgi:hypothetical protein
LSPIEPIFPFPLKFYKNALPPNSASRWFSSSQVSACNPEVIFSFTLFRCFSCHSSSWSMVWFTMVHTISFYDF